MPISGGINWVTVQKALQNWVVACTGLAADHVVWGQQNGGRPSQPGINMRLMLNEDTDIPWVDTDNQRLQINTLTITSANATTNTFTKTAHGLLTGDGPVVMSGADLPSSISPLLVYWVIKIDANTFKLAASFADAMNGVAVSLGDNGSGTFSLDSNSETLRAGKELKYIQTSLVKATLTLECYTDIGVGMDMASAILWRVAARRLLPTPVAILEAANIGVSEVTRVRSYGGTQGQYIFEPRASVDVLLYLISSDSEDGSIFERAEITNETTGDMWVVGLDGVLKHSWSSGFSSGFGDS